MRKRRVFVLLVSLVMLGVWVIASQTAYMPSGASETVDTPDATVDTSEPESRSLAMAVLKRLKSKAELRKPAIRARNLAMAGSIPVAAIRVTAYWRGI